MKLPKTFVFWKDVEKSWYSPEEDLFLCKIDQFFYVPSFVKRIWITLHGRARREAVELSISDNALFLLVDGIYVAFEDEEEELLLEALEGRKCVYASVQYKE